MGVSFTGNPMENTPWPDVLQEGFGTGSNGINTARKAGAGDGAGKGFSPSSGEAFHHYKKAGDYFFAAFLSRSYFSAPTQSFAKAHHSMQDVPMGRAFICPHFLHAVSGSSLQISILSPHFWQRISSGFGDRISALPGHPSLNMA
jgi:hypothetical protein